MKTFLPVALLCAILTMPALGEEKIICGDVGALAATIMEERQQDLTLSSQMANADKMDLPEVTKDLVRGIVFEAYDVTLWLTETSKRTAVSDFRNKFERECFIAQRNAG